MASKVERLESKLRRMKRDSDVILRGLDEGIEGAEAMGLRSEFIADLRAQRQQRRELFNRFITQTEEQLRSARGEAKRLKHERDGMLRARANSEEAKARSLAYIAWIDGGGSPRAFEQAWPDLWRTHLERKSRRALRKVEDSEVKL